MSRGLLLLVVCSPVVAQETASFKVRDVWIGAVALGRDGTTLYVGTSKGFIDTFDLTKKPLGQLSHIGFHDNAVATLALSRAGGFVSGGHDHLAVISDRVFPRFLHGHKGAVMSVALAPDDKLIATGSIDGTIRLWDAKTAKQDNVLTGHKSWVNGVVFDPFGSTLYSAGSDNSVRVWNVKTRKLEHTFPVKEGEVRSVAISPDGKRLAAGIRYGSVRVWDVATKKEVAFWRAHEEETWAVAFTPDGKTLISGGGTWNQPSQVRLWDTGIWEETASLKHPGEVLCLALSSDGKKLAAGGGDGTVKVWDLAAVQKRP